METKSEKETRKQTLERNSRTTKVKDHKPGNKSKNRNQTENWFRFVYIIFPFFEIKITGSKENGWI